MRCNGKWLWLICLLAGVGRAQTGTCVAIPMTYHVVANRSKFLSLAAYSYDVTYVTHSYLSPETLSVRYKADRLGCAGAVTQWQIKSLPSHGTLYESMVALDDEDTLTDPDELTYIPTTEYTGQDSFTFQVTDSTGTSNIATVTLVVEAAASYSMPIGIPNPGFGIADEPPADPPEWPSAVATGYYYVDNTPGHGGTDSSNTYGYPNKPRLTVPAGPIIGAGKKMVIIASEIPYAVVAGTSYWRRWTMMGTAESRAWVVGQSDSTTLSSRSGIRPILGPSTVLPPTSISRHIRMRGAYWTIDGLDFDTISLQTETSYPTYDYPSYFCVRHCRIRDAVRTSGNVISLSESVVGTLTDVVIFDCHIHDNGDIDETLSDERDVHGIGVAHGDEVYILDNVLHENGGDSVQINGEDEPRTNLAANVYVGRNKMHTEGENAVDIKSHDGVIVSENDGWDFRRVTNSSSGGNSQIFYQNDEFPQYRGSWFLANRAWDSAACGVGVQAIDYGVSTDGRSYVLGNLCVWCERAIWIWPRAGGQAYAYDNTVLLYRLSGLSVAGLSSTQQYVSGNFIGAAGVGESHIEFLDATTPGSVQDMDWNYVEGTLVYQDYSDNMHDLAWTQANTAWMDHGKENQSPSFTDAAGFDYTIATDSDLKDQRATAYDVYALFTATFGTSAALDRSGDLRPQDTNWDIGWDEFNGEDPPETAPTAATNPDPADTTTGVSRTAQLSWTGGLGATGRDVYFGTDATPDETELQGNQQGVIYDPGTLEYNTIYYWRIDETNAYGTTTGTVWSFTTEEASAAPDQPVLSSPSNAGTVTSSAVTLRWGETTGAETYTVYLNQTGTFDAGDIIASGVTGLSQATTVADDATYYWQVVAVNDADSTASATWSFTTDIPTTKWYLRTK